MRRTAGRGKCHLDFNVLARIRLRLCRLGLDGDSVDQAEVHDVDRYLRIVAILKCGDYFFCSYRHISILFDLWNRLWASGFGPLERAAMKLDQLALLLVDLLRKSREGAVVGGGHNLLRNSEAAHNPQILALSLKTSAVLAELGFDI